MMQRDYVWKSAKVVKLLDSLYKKWPIGCFYVWHSTAPQSNKARAGQSSAPKLSIDGFYGFLLDGQQRLTSLALAIKENNAEHSATRAFLHIEKERFYLGNSNETFSKRIEQGDPRFVPLSDLITTIDREPRVLQNTIQRVIDELRERELVKTPQDETEYRSRLQAVAVMLHQNALCEEFHNDHVADAIELFARLNKGGTSLSAGDVEAARLSQEDTKHIVEPMRDFVRNPALTALGFNFSFVTRALVTIHRDSSTFSKLPHNWASTKRDIDQSWRATSKGLLYAAALARDDLGWATRRWLPSANALIPIAYLFKASKTNPSKQEREDIKRYLLLTALRSLFRGGVETAINTYVNPIKTAHANTKNRGRLLVDKIPNNRLYKIKPEDIRTATGMYSPLMQIYLSYLLSKEARSWPSGLYIREIALKPSGGDTLAVHHIFPRKYMTSLSYPPEKFNTMANYAIVAQSDNSTLADKPPALAYAKLSSQEKKAASSQLLLKDLEELLDEKRYEDFLGLRAKKLAEALNDFIGL